MLRAPIVIAACTAALLLGCERPKPDPSPDPSPEPASEPPAGETPTRPPAPDPILLEVVANMQGQPIDGHTLRDLHLPETFLRRIANRIIRESFQQQRYVVYGDAAAVTGSEAEPVDAPARPTGPGHVDAAALIRLLHADAPEPVVTARRGLAEMRPGRRGYRAPILEPVDAIAEEPLSVAASAVVPGLPALADLVARRLASDGLLATLAQGLEQLERLEPDLDAPALAARLHAAGYPLDLLAYFAPERAVDATDAPPAPVATLAHAAGLIAEGRRGADLRRSLIALPFRPVPTRPGFRVVTESGEHEIGLLRLQLTRGDYWRHAGAGGSVDILRQLVTRLPDVELTASIETRFLATLLETAAGWPLGPPGRVTLLAEPLTVAQWAQDNAKPGLVGDPQRPAWATIVPRYASRRDDGSMFVPGESFLVETFAASGHDVIHSPLLFQGGNLIAVRDPANGDRILLIGESEIFRNTALGLTPAQATEALRIEFGVDRCVVLPSVAFHIDFDLCVRAVGDRLVAFVNDRHAAARLLIERGLDALDAVDRAAAQTAREHLRAGNMEPMLATIRGVIADRMDARGRYPLSLANHFTQDPADSPVGNLQRFFVAMDVLAADDPARAGRPVAPQLVSYLEAFRRAEADHRALVERLRGLGWTIVPVPSLAEGGRSVNYVNGIHDRTRYLMPAYGGFFAPLDEAAAATFATHLGEDVTVVPILCAESQRRSGAVHCSASAYPRLETIPTE